MTDKNDCSHCGDTTSHCVGCGACPTRGQHWNGCPMERAQDVR